MKGWFWGLVAAVCFSGLIYLVNSDSPALRQLAATEKKQPAIQAVDFYQSAQVKAKAVGRQHFVEADLAKLLSNLPVSQRRKVISDPQLFQRLIDQELTRLALVNTALSVGLDSDSKIKYLMTRKTQDLLIAALVDQHVRAYHPSKEQVRAYYESHSKQFVQKSAMPVWQVFWQTNEGLSDDQQLKLLVQAKRLSKELQLGQARFFDVANQYSEHEPSRLQGGFMGILKLDQLRPAIKRVLLALPVNQVSQPVRSEQGVHIFLRGQVIPEQKIAFDSVQDEICKRLVAQHTQQQRQRLGKQARNRYPISFDFLQIEDWRLRQLQSLHPTAIDTVK